MKLLNTHFKSVENITDGRFVPYITGCVVNFKGILSTKIVIFSYPKLLSFSVLTFIKWRLTPSYAAKDTIFWQKRPKTIVIRIIDLDDNIQIYSYGFYVNPSWACALFRNNKQHVVLGQESGLWRIQRERWIEVWSIFQME